MRSIIIIALLISLSAWNASSAQVGIPAPSFSIKDLSNRTMTLNDLRQKVVLLAFWAPWCIPCRDELPELDRLYKKFQGEGFIAIGIAVDASPERVAKFMQKVPVSFPILMDTQGTVAEVYGLSHIPTGYLIGRDGIIRHCHPAYSRDFLNLYEQEITELLKQ